ncbi:MAG: TIGR02710 family CRISPR-associated CARF protein [Pseudomonadota bacterium]|nr:TIGR02710 family CRISPR-associated CARF protein [Pseudomonadota bacterium]
MQETILICTVGGSHRPILKAIETSRPEYVCFICTGPDPETGGAGSERQVVGKGNVISEVPGTPAILPNIPILAGLAEQKFEVCRVPADDLDRAFLEIYRTIHRLKEHFPEYRLIADYTGGTKTMTAALVTAVLESDDVELQLVTGARPDLVRVTDQTESAITPRLDKIRLRRAMQPYLDAWKRYAYDEAAEGLGQLADPANPELRGELNRVRNLSRGFASWDRFDHRAALEFLELYRPRIGETLGLHLTALAMLIEDDSKRRQPLQLYDLWLNARRRAHQGAMMTRLHVSTVCLNGLPNGSCVSIPVSIPRTFCLSKYHRTCHSQRTGKASIRPGCINRGNYWPAFFPIILLLCFSRSMEKRCWIT